MHSHTTLNKPDAADSRNSTTQTSQSSYVFQGTSTQKTLPLNPDEKRTLQMRTHAELFNSYAGRSRSDSVGTTASSLSVDSTDSTAEPLSFVLAVIGTAGCGKSTLIKKAMKTSSPSVSQVVDVPAGNNRGPFRYHFRTGRRRYAYHSTLTSYTVLELDSTTLFDDQCKWPQAIAQPDGVLLCYDVTKEESFDATRHLLKNVTLFARIPVMVMACKGDIVAEVDPRHAAKLQRHDVGLVVVNSRTDAGKEKIRDSFDWITKAVVRNLQQDHRFVGQFRNPASPSVLFELTPWDDRRSDQATPRPDFRPAVVPSTTVDEPAKLSPSLARVVESSNAQGTKPGSSHISAEGLASSQYLPDNSVQRDDPRAASWQTVGDLIQKLAFCSISGDDSVFVKRFLIIYRCFIDPRAVLLVLEARLRSFDQLALDNELSIKFGQMRLCHTLSMWIDEYPGDLYLSDATTALQSIAKFMMSKPYLLHYASTVLVHIESIGKVPSDPAADWAFRPKSSVHDDPGVEQEVPTQPNTPEPPSSRPTTAILAHTSQGSLSQTSSAVELPEKAQRDRKHSLPFSSRGPSLTSIGSNTSVGSVDGGHRHMIRELLAVSEELYTLEPIHVANEITRLQLSMFLSIKPRDWLQWMYRFTRKDALVGPDPVTHFLDFVNHLADWVASLVLAHEKPKARAKQVERLVLIAEKLRKQQNYSACRSFVAGIHHCLADGDAAMDNLLKRAPEQHKLLHTYVLLFKNSRSHHTYRQALRVVKGICVPDIEVHSSDILKAHLNNPDTDESGKIHWAKFNMIAKFILELVQFQSRSRNALDSEPQRTATMEEHIANQENLARRDEQRSSIAYLWRESVIMNHETQRSRMESLADLRHSRDHSKPHERSAFGSESRSDKGQHKDSILRKFGFKI